jgi:hypothetical protein
MVENPFADDEDIHLSASKITSHKLDGENLGALQADTLTDDNQQSGAALTNQASEEAKATDSESEQDSDSEEVDKKKQKK